MKTYKNLLELFLSKRDAKDRGFHFIVGKDNEEFVSFHDILIAAANMEKQLEQNHIKAGDKAVFQIESDKQFIISYWACVLANVTLVPLPLSKGQENVKKVLRVLEQFENAFLLIDAKSYEQLKSNEEILDKMQCPVICVDDVLKETTADIDFERYKQKAELLDGDSIVIIQFSSGSTGVPKGVMTSHKNIIADIEGVTKACEIVDDDVLLSWVPLAHNFGLIGSHILGVMNNLNTYFMKMDLFLYHPSLWLEYCTKYGATITCSPNFGYKYFLNLTKDQALSNINLSKLRMIIDSAEPVSIEVCNAFKERLKPYGLRENVFLIAYGLSESTVASTATVPNKPLNCAQIDAAKLVVGEKIHLVEDITQNAFQLKLISVGKPLKGLKLRITDDQNIVQEEQYYGNIQLQGDMICAGYFHADEANKNLFTEDNWLITGDMGFILDGDVYVCGRKKDIIIVNGKNYYSSDLEDVLYQFDATHEYIVSSIQKSDDMQEQILVFVKTSDELSQFRIYREEIKKILLSQCGLSTEMVIPVDEIPKTVSGKKQRFKLVESYRNGDFQEVIDFLDGMEKTSEKKVQHKIPKNREKVIADIQNSIKDVLGIVVEDRDANLTEYGMNSIKAAQFAAYINANYEKNLEAFFLYDYPTIDTLADFLMGEEKENNGVVKISKSSYSDDIAVIAMECRFPGANSVDEYWRNLLDGVDAVREIPEERTKIYEYFQKKEKKQYGGFLNDVDLFASRLFGVTPLEAEKLDPQQRMLLEVTYDAFQNGGMDIANTKGSNTGVFVGITNSDYRELLLEDTDEDEIDDLSMTGNMMNMAAGRLSYVFDWHGPALSIDTACSSSLVAIHEAVNSLRTMQCDMAVSCGVNLIFSPKGYIGLSKIHALSKEGRCKTFDDTADGYCRSEGCGVVILKRYEEAVRDGDNILAVIKGSAVNHDGRSNGLTAPNGVAQTELIRRALADANVERQDVDYIEAHGTGTKIGDPQEVNALAKVFQGINKRIYLGSVKSNIGHAESAAGIASFIKAVLLVQHGVIPKKIHCKKQNTALNWDELPFEVNAENVSLLSEQKPWTAAISSFGFSGTNVHMVVQQTQEKDIVENKNYRLFTVSAISKELLLQDLTVYRDYISKTENSFEDICMLSNQMRSGEKYRLGILACSKEDLINQLEQFIELKRELPGVNYQEKNQVISDISELLATDPGQEQLEQLYNQGAKLNWNQLRNLRSCKNDMPPRTKKKRKFWYN